MKLSSMLPAFVGAAVCLLATIADAGPATHIKIESGRILGLADDGRLVWQYHAAGPIQVATRPDGNYIVNGTSILGRNGRLLAKIPPHSGNFENASGDFAPAVDESATPAWGPLATLVSSSSGFTAPVFDDAGNAWVVVDNAPNGTSDVMKSVGSSGTWQKMTSLPTEVYALDGSIAVDAAGAVTIAKVDGDGTGANVIIKAVRYQPNTGWGPETTLLTVPANIVNAAINNVYVGADDQGNAVVVADAILYGAAYIVYSEVDQKWLPLKQMPLPQPAIATTPTVEEPALSVSQNRNHIQYSYASAPIQQPSIGLYTNAFDSSKLEFGSPNRAPDTKKRVGYYVEHGDKVIVSVDNSGAIEMLWIENTRNKKKNGIYASRFENGSWSATVKVSDTEYELDGFAAQSMDSAGDFLVSTPTGNGSTDVAQLLVFKYVVGSGWSIQIAATWGGMQVTQTSIAWLGTSGQAVGIFMVSPDQQSAYHALSFATWNGTTWSTPAPVPGNTPNISFLQRTATGPNGQVILLFDPTNSSYTQYFTNTYSSFMVGQ